MFASLVAMLLSHTTLQKMEEVAFSFRGVGYVHRYSKDNLHEYTPKGKPDLKSWTDMVTINDYAAVKSGEELAKGANSVLDAYKRHNAMVVKTDSVPRSMKREAEHLIVVMFPTPTYIEASFTRFLMSDGVGHSIVYSHRVYGKKAGNSMSQWLSKEGEGSEKALMAMPTVPKH